MKKHFFKGARSRRDRMIGQGVGRRGPRRRYIQKIYRKAAKVAKGRRGEES